MEEGEVGARSRNQASHSRLHIMYLDAGTRLSCAHFILSAHERESVSAVILARTPIMSHSRPALQASAASVPRSGRPRLERRRSAWAGSCSVQILLLIRELISSPSNSAPGEQTWCALLPSPACDRENIAMQNDSAKLQMSGDHTALPLKRFVSMRLFNKCA